MMHSIIIQFNHSLMIDFKVIHFKKKFNFIAFNLFNSDSLVYQLVEMLIIKKNHNDFIIF